MTYRALQATLGPIVRRAWKLSVEGAGWMPDGPVVVVSNHDSLLDPFFLGAAFERQLRFVGKQELFRGPLSPFLRSAGAIPIARGRGDRTAVLSAQSALEQGDAVALFPQGTILGSPDRPWRRGAARLALAAGAPILPVCLPDSDGALHAGSRRVRFPVVHVIVGPPLEVERLSEPTPEAALELTERVRDAVRALRPAAGPG